MGTTEGVRWPTPPPRGVAAAALATRGLHAAFMLEQTPSVAYVPILPGSVAQSPGAVIGRDYRNRGLNSLRSFWTKPVPYSTALGKTPVSRARLPVVARQKSREIVTRGVACPCGSSPGTDPPLSTRRPRRRNADEYPRKAPKRADRKGESGETMTTQRTGETA